MRNNTPDLDTADILAGCLTYVPVNAHVDQAIAAHRIAFKASDGDAEAHRLADYIMRAVIFAVIATVEDAQATLDYLAALLDEAWPEHPEQAADAFREATLANFRRIIGWRLAD